MKIKSLLTLSILALGLSGCVTQKFPMAKGPITVEPSYSRTQHAVWWDKVFVVDPVAVCGSANNVAMLETDVNTGQAWLRVITANIYAPYTANVYCKNPPARNYSDRPYRAPTRNRRRVVEEDNYEY